MLRCQAAYPEGVSAKDAHEAAADVLSVSDEDKQELLPSGAQPIYKNRAGWAHDRLKRAGTAESELLELLGNVSPSFFETVVLLESLPSRQSNEDEGCCRSVSDCGPRL